MSTDAASNAMHEADLVSSTLHQTSPANTSSVKARKQSKALCSM